MKRLRKIVATSLAFGLGFAFVADLQGQITVTGESRTTSFQQKRFTLDFNASVNAPMDIFDYQLRVEARDPNGLAVAGPEVVIESIGQPVRTPAPTNAITNQSVAEEFKVFSSSVGFGSSVNIITDPAQEPASVVPPFALGNDGLIGVTLGLNFPAAPAPNTTYTIHVLDDQTPILGNDATQFVQDQAGQNLLTYSATAASLTISPQVLGDMNGSGVVTNGDINPFVLALTNPAQFAIDFPLVDPNVAGDLNGDGVFTNGDINPMVTLLTGGGLPPAAVVPEPNNIALTAFLGVCALALSRRNRAKSDPSS